MPLTKITNKSYLNELVALAPVILSEYLATLETTIPSKPVTIEGWRLTEVLRNRSLLPNANQIPTLKTFIENLPTDVYPIMTTISSVRGTELTDEMIHSEAYPENMHRYHIPLHACDNAVIHIEEDNTVWTDYTWEDGFAYEFENPQNNHYLSHNDTVDDRIIIILDVFEGVEPTAEETSICENIIASFIEVE
jgi:hypothetical protein